MIHVSSHHAVRVRVSCLSASVAALRTHVLPQQPQLLRAADGVVQYVVDTYFRHMVPLKTQTGYTK